MAGDLFGNSTRWERLAVPDADVRILRSLDLGAPAAAVLAQLLGEVAWRQESIVLFGKPMLQPRLLAWHGDAGAAYTYSGVRHEPLAWTPLLASIRQSVQAATGLDFNSVLLNLYRDERDSMGMHADDEPELGPEPAIASLSLGEERTLVLRHRRDRSVRSWRLPLPSGSLLLMQGATQANWHHGVPKRTAPCGPRVNLTFRRVRAAH